MSARDRLVAELREHALIVGRVTLTSGREAEYYVDAKRAILRPAGFHALGELLAERARLERDIRDASSRARLVPLAERRLGMHLPLDSEIVLLVRPRIDRIDPPRRADAAP